MLDSFCCHSYPLLMFVRYYSQTFIKALILKSTWKSKSTFFTFCGTWWYSSKYNNWCYNSWNNFLEFFETTFNLLINLALLWGQPPEGQNQAPPSNISHWISCLNWKYMSKLVKWDANNIFCWLYKPWQCDYSSLLLVMFFFGSAYSALCENLTAVKSQWCLPVCISESKHSHMMHVETLS